MTTRPTTFVADRAEQQIREADAALGIGSAQPPAAPPAGPRPTNTIGPATAGDQARLGPPLAPQGDVQFDPYAQARVVSPWMVPADPMREATITKLTGLGLLYAPTMGKALSKATANRLYDWAKDDPELMRLLEEDFRRGVSEAQRDWSSRAPSVGEQFWRETTQVILEASGLQLRREREQQLLREEEDAREVGGDAWRGVVARFTPGSKQKFIFDAFAAFMPGFEAIPLWGQKLQIDAAAEQAENIRRKVEFGLGADDIIVGIARQIHSESGMAFEQAFGSAQNVWDQLPEDQKQEIIRETRDLSADDLVEEFTRLTAEEMSRPGAIVDAATLGAAEAMAHWTTINQTIGTIFFDQLGQLVPDDIKAEILPDYKPPVRALTDEGWQAFKTSYMALKEDGGIAKQYFGLEGPEASWVNLATDVVFDPLNVFTAGGSQATRRFAKLLGTAEGADAWLAQTAGRRMTKTIAGTNDALKLASHFRGMSPAARVALIDATDEAVVADILRNEMVNGYWLPNSGALGRRVSSYQGFGRLGEALGRSSDSKLSELVTNLLHRSDHTRVINLGDSHFIDEAEQIIVARFRNDPARARQALNELYDTVRRYQHGYDEALNNGVDWAAKIKAERQTIRNTLSPGARKVAAADRAAASAADDITYLESQIAELHEQQQKLMADEQALALGDDIGRTAAELQEESVALADNLSAADQLLDMARRAVDANTALVDTYGPELDEALERYANTKREINRLRRSVELPADRLKQRALLSDWIDNFYDEWGAEIGLPTDPGGNISWKMVQRGGRGPRKVWKKGRTLEAAAGRLQPFEDATRALRAKGWHGHAAVLDEVGRSGVTHALPASPYEMILYETMPQGQAAKLVRGAFANSVLKVNDFARLVWAFNLLANPFTAAKAHIEDVVKFWVESGRVGRAGQALLGGRSASSGAEQYLKGIFDSLDRSATQFVMTDASKDFVGARRWFEGSILTDDLMRAWGAARKANDPRIFTEFWESTAGKARQQAGIDGATIGHPLAADQAYRMLSEVLGEWAKRLEPGVLDEVITLLADGAQTAPKGLIRKLGDVPVQRTRGTNPASKFFDLFYGAPARRRGSIFFDHFYDEAMSIYQSRFTGRIVDDTDLIGRISHGLGVSDNEARILLAQRHHRVVQYMDDMGLVTRGRLEEMSRKWAREQTEGLMYLSGATSIAGRMGAKVMPFAPAQFDFLRFWSRQLFDNTQLATDSRALAPFLKGLSHIAPAGTAARLQRAAQFGADIPIPFNARLASRWSALATEQGRLSEQEQFDLRYPTSLIERFTFFPIGMADSQNFLVDMSPGFGPLPTWLIHRLPEDDPRRQALEDLFPSLTWVTDSDAGPWESIAPFLLPITSRSVTGLIGKVGRIGAGLTGAEDAFDVGGFNATFDLAREPIGFSDYFRAAMGDLLAAEPGIDLNSEYGQQRVAELMVESRRKASLNEGLGGIAGYFGITNPWRVDGIAVNHLEPLSLYMEELKEGGVVGSAQADDFIDLWSRRGDLNRAEKDHLADVGVGILFDLPDVWQDYVIARHPQLAIFLVPSTEGRFDSQGRPIGPEEYLFGDGRINNRHPDLMGPKGAEKRMEGFEKGWFGPRDPTEVAMDMAVVAAEAKRSTIKTWWERTTGREWRKGLTKALEGASFRLGDKDRALLESVGVTVDATTVGELRNQLNAGMKGWTEYAGDFREKSFWKRVYSTPELQWLGEEFDRLEELAADRDIRSIWDWPETARTYLREQIGEAVKLDPELARQYNADMSRWLGQLDFKKPVPPPIEDLDIALRPTTPIVVDGDTLEVVTRDGTIRVRLIGINTPEEGQEGYLEAAEALDKLIDGRDIVLGVFDPDKYWTTRIVDAEGTRRLYAWLYVDGKPLFDPNQFTGDNPSGVRTGGEVPDYAALLGE